MESYRDIYRRFITNYRNDNGGICLYPQFDYDLDTLLEWLENDDCMGDVLVNGDWAPTWIDCGWHEPEGE